METCQNTTWVDGMKHIKVTEGAKGSSSFSRLGSSHGLRNEHARDICFLEGMRNTSSKGWDDSEILRRKPSLDGLSRTFLRGRVVDQQNQVVELLLILKCHSLGQTEDQKKRLPWLKSRHSSGWRIHSMRELIRTSSTTSREKGNTGQQCVWC